MLDPVACALFVVTSFVLSGIAQTAWLASHVSHRFDFPLDAGFRLNGKRILGDNKTLRGFLIMIPATALAFGLLRGLVTRIEPRWAESLWPLSTLHYFGLGALASLGFMLGEIPNSFIKRRLGIPPGRAPRRRMAWTACFVGDRLDSILGMLLAIRLVVPTPASMWLIVLLIGPALHLLFSATLGLLGAKQRWA